MLLAAKLAGVSGFCCCGSKLAEEGGVVCGC